jgi:S-adenosylmethionine uptake transporter
MHRPGPALAGALLALAGFAIFALHDAIIKLLGASYGAPQLVFCSALAGLVPVLLLIRLQGGIAMPRGQARRLTWLRSLMVFASMLSAFHAFANLPLAQTYAILFATPLVIALLAVPILGERLGMARLAAIVIGLAGVLIVLQPGREALQIGHASALFSAFGSALVSVLSRRIGTQAPLGLMLIQPVALNLIFLGAMMPFVFQPMPPGDVLLAAVLGLCAVAAMALMISAYRLAQAAVVAPLQYSQAVWALIYGAFLFDEVPAPATMVGAAAVIISGVFVVVHETRQRPAPAPARDA